MYDYLIVGAGPCGLALAWYLSKLNKKILIVEKENTIGGCHRVRRVNGLLTEHGPRIYLDNYKNFITILNEMGKDFYDVFVRYHFNISNIGGNSINKFKLYEIAAIVSSYLYFMLNPDYYKKISVLDYSKSHIFREETIDYLDRLCRLTDGAGAKRYTMYEFFELLNQNFLYNIYQPRLPNDVGLFKYWQDALLKTGNVDLLLNSNVIKVNEEDGKIESLLVSGENGIKELKADKYILAIPPKYLVNLLSNSSYQIQNAFGKYQEVKQWEKEARYIVYIPVTYHWNKKLDLPDIWGFPKTDWGVAFIVLSEYMKFNNQFSKTVITAAATINNKKSKHTGKTADESTEGELKEEIFRQLRESYPNLEMPTVSLLSEGIYREDNRWKTLDTAFMLTKEGYLEDMEYKNLYNVGTHSGHSFYGFTAMESAVTNAFYLGMKLEPELKKMYRIEEMYTVNKLAILLVMVVLVVVLFMFRQRQ
jgi:hypothetical protein